MTFTQISGIIGRHVLFTPLEELATVTDFDHRLPHDQWWLKIRPLLRILAKHRDSYVQEVPQGEAGTEQTTEGWQNDF